MKGRLLFEEVQRFRYTISWWVLMVVSVPFFGGFLYALYQQLILGVPVGDRPMGDLALILVSLSMIILLTAVIWLFQVMKLHVKIDEGMLFYSFYPFFSEMRAVKKGETKNLYVRKYKPILEYGGWGYRIRWKRGKAFNVSGKWGLQLIFNNGKKILIGTQKPGELEIAIEKLKENWRRD